MAANPNDSIQTIEHVLPHGDFDGDGMANVYEFLAGTSPIDSASLFAASIHVDSPGVAATIRWHSAPGKIYTVYKSTELSAGFQILQDNIAATPPLNTLIDSVGSERAFYIIEVR